MTEQDKTRIALLLEHDKEIMNEPSRLAAIADFKRVAEEYFETDGGFLLTTRKAGKATEVVLTFRIRRVKNFTIIK